MPAMSTNVTAAGRIFSEANIAASRGEARIGHRDDTDIGFDGRERVVGGQHVVVRQGVEHG